MSDTPQQPVERKEKAARVSRRGRRLLALILVGLTLLLITVGFFLFRILVPANEVATGDKAGGLEWVRSIYGFGADPSQQLRMPASAAAAPDGTIWVADAVNARILAFNPDGTFKSSIKGTAEDPLILPTDVKVDAEGRVYVLETTQDELHVLTADNQQLMVKKIQKPTGVAISADRIIVGSAAGFAIMDKEGNVLKIVGTQGKGEDQFDTVNGVAIAKDGTFYILDTFNNRLSHYDKDGNRIWEASLGKAGNKNNIQVPGSNSATGTALQLPSDMTFDANNRLIVVDPFDFSISVVDPKDGKIVKKYGRYGSEDGQFAYPSSISYDKGRDWFVVADSANNRVQIVRIPDSGGTPLTSAAATLTGPIRACLIPLILILIAIIVAVVVRMRRKSTKPAQAAQASLTDVKNDQE
jgi:sugar lactone lactonase YvrE